MADVQHLSLDEKKRLVQALSADIEVSVAKRTHPDLCESCRARAAAVALIEALAFYVAVTYEDPSDVADVVAILTRSVQAYVSQTVGRDLPASTKAVH